MTRAAPALAVELVSPPAPTDACARFLDLPHVLLLDSAVQSPRRGRFSFLAADPAVVVRSKGPITSVRARGSTVWHAAPGGALETVERLLRTFVADRLVGLPPFQGGAAGYIGYEYGGRLERLPAPSIDTLTQPDVVLGLYDWVVAWDHATGHGWIVSTGIPERGQRGEMLARERMQMVRERLAGPARAPTAVPRVRPGPALERFPVRDVPGADAIDLQSTFSREGYVQAVRRVRDYILAGDIFQANLSQRFDAQQAGSPFLAYRRLCRRNPAAFAAYFVTDEAVVLSVSPERLLRLDHRGHVESSPIKGTRPRGESPESDAALAAELLSSPKDRAENVMIADLLRNDLSRVCRPGSVRASTMLELETHPTVHHLVSTIVGELAPDSNRFDLLRAAFPGGSITGAPKVRAMEIIAELEPTVRGVYCGSIGYLSVTGEVDLSIAIRTGVRVGHRFYFQAGGGIVADSDAEAEYQETLDKARALIDACHVAPEPVEIDR